MEIASKVFLLFSRKYLSSGAHQKKQKTIMSRILTFIAALLLLALYASPQKLKKKVDVKGKLKEVYFVQKGTKLRHSISFVVNTENKDTLTMGYWENGQRTGLWCFKDKKTRQAFLAYDFSNENLVFMNNELLSDSFLVKTENGFEVSKVERPLLYTGYNDELRMRIAQQIKVPLEAMQSGKIGLSILSFRVDTIGHIVATEVVSSYHSELDQQLSRIIYELPGKFLPPIVEGRPVESIFYVRANIGFPRESFSESRPYIKHCDITYSSTTTKRSMGISVQKVPLSEINRY